MTAIMENNIQLANITKEINRLWDEEQGKKKVRASLFNLILYIEKSDKNLIYQRLTRSVISKFPGRILLIQHDQKSPEPSLKTHVSSETIGEGDLKILCETIHVEVSGDLIARVPFIILPHLLPDLPTLLFWTQDPSTKSAVFDDLERIVDRIIFDAQFSKDLQKYTQTVLSFRNKYHCSVSDLNWSALWGWRRLIEQNFETPETLFHLAQSTLLRIEYNQVNGIAHPEIRAAYLQAWIASRMNWKFQHFEINEGTIRIVYKRPMHDVVILIAPNEISELPPGAIISLEIESQRNKGHFVFKRSPKSTQVFVQYSDKDRCDLPYVTHLVGMHEGQEIVSEIFFPSQSSHYQGALEVLAQIPWKRS